MRNFLFLSFLILSSLTDSIGQLLTNAQIFAAKTDAIIESELIFVGSLKTSFDEVSFSVVKHHDKTNNLSKSCLKITSSDLFNFIDSDEIDGLIKSLKVIDNTILKTKKESNVDLLYRCKSGLSFGAFYYVNSEKWAPFIRGSKRDTNMPIEKFSEMISILEQCKLKI